MNGSATTRLPEIEVLRGVAVAGVVVHHMQGNLVLAPHRLLDAMLTYLDYWTGVDLFFAISGFVIARSLLPAVGRVRGVRGFMVVAVGFWIRRAWRLLPSAWLWLALCVGLAAGFNHSGVFGTVRTNGWAALAGMLDFADFRFADAFFRFHYGASFAWWSLSLEEQFYLLLPPLAFLAGRALPWLLGLAVLLQFPLVRTPWLMAFRTDAILLGVLLAVAARRPGFSALGDVLARLPWWWRRLPAALLVLALGALGNQALAFSHFRIGPIAVVSVLLVYLAAQDRGLVLGPGWSRRVMMVAGARSYALYLVHIPAFFIAREVWFRIGPQPTEIPVALTGLALMACFAELNWRLVERPLRAHGGRVATRWADRHAMVGS
jgi:peptidoglycan/LPS O-acetylase OafA/YrhL